MDIKKIERLLALVEESEIEELEIEVKGFGGRAIRVRKGPVSNSQTSVNVMGNPAEGAVAMRPVKSGGNIENDEPKDTDEPTIDEGLVEIVSPIVGTFYRAPSPDAEPYVKEGDRIAVGQEVCIVEAMKLMNEIQSEFAGTVERILVENAQPVEYGQPLFLIRTEK